jgi:TatD DNase family protein
MATFYDTHAHLQDADFASDLPEVIARAQAAGITRVVTIGIDLATSRHAIELAERFPAVFAAVGWHPSEALSAPADIRPDLRKLAAHPKVLALGETGLDYYRLPSSTSGASADADRAYKQRQAELFEQHLEVGGELGLNCVIHQRAALEDTLARLQPHAGKVRGVFHCFAESPTVLRRILDLNSLVSFTGILTFKNGQNIREALAAAPMGAFMLETDSPYLAPVPHRGKRCEPAFVKEIAAVAAQVKSCSLEELSEATTAAADGFFRRPPGS